MLRGNSHNVTTFVRPCRAPHGTSGLGRHPSPGCPPQIVIHVAQRAAATCPAAHSFEKPVGSACCPCSRGHTRTRLAARSCPTGFQHRAAVISALSDGHFSLLLGAHQARHARRGEAVQRAAIAVTAVEDGVQEVRDVGACRSTGSTQSASMPLQIMIKWGAQAGRKYYVDAARPAVQTCRTAGLGSANSQLCRPKNTASTRQPIVTLEGRTIKHTRCPLQDDISHERLEERSSLRAHRRRTAP